MSNQIRTLFGFLTVVGGALATGCAPSEQTEVTPEKTSGEWRRWRGSNGTGVSQETDLPMTWSEGSSNIRWKARVPGAGNSSPIASGGRIFITTAYGAPEDDWDMAWSQPELHRVLLSLDSETGEVLWQKSLFHGQKGEVHYTNTRAAPTPVTDGRLVFVSFDAILTAVDFAGEIVWQKDLDPDYYRDSHYGVATSPVLFGDTVILMQDREEGEAPDPGWMVALDRQTGEQLWRDEWMHTCCSYTTPILLDRADGSQELAHSSSAEVVGYDPLSGERLWTAVQSNIQPVPSLIAHGDLLAAPGGYHNRSFAMFRLAGSGKDTTTETAWELGGGVPKITTPLFYRNRLFVLTENRILRAYELETGTVIWKGRVAPGDYWPSLVAGDGKLYTLNQYGVVTVVDAEADTFQILATNSLGEGNRGATPAIAEGCLLIRTTNHLYCVEKAAAAAA